MRIGKFAFLVAAFAVILPLLAAAPAGAAGDNKYAALVVDANTGKVLFARSADSRRFPASLTKIMTLYVLFEELDANRLTLKSKLKVSANAARQPPSKLGVKAGSTIAVEDAIRALVTKSANDVAVVVAENVSGSVDAFATRMTRTARALGMKSTTFKNPHGLPNSGQTTTATDLVRLATAIQDRFPTYYKYFSTKSFTYRGARHGNHNRLLGSVAGVDGIKTGYTRASGFNLVTNVERDGRHVIAVVLGGRTASSRDAHMRELIAKYLPKAKRGTRTSPLLVVDTGAADVEVPAAAVAAAAIDPRLPRSRPEAEESEEAVLAYAAAGAPHDVIAEAMAAADDEDIAEGTADAENAEGDVGDAPEDDPIAHRIEIATAVAEFADVAMVGGSHDPIARLTELARIRAGVKDIVADGPAPDMEAAANDNLPDGWNIQIGATPTPEGAQELIEKARSTMGTQLASLQPVTQEIDHRGTTLYRARFAGFADKDEARAMCDKLKRKAFACLAVAN